MIFKKSYIDVEYINPVTVYLKHIQLISTITETLPFSFMYD